MAGRRQRVLGRLIADTVPLYSPPMRRMRTMGLVALTLLSGCPGGTPDTRPDVPFVPRDVPPMDLGMPDVPPPVCTGTAAPCTGAGSCAPGCYQRACTGTPTSCRARFDYADCRADLECTWDSREMRCDGDFVTGCFGYTSRDPCRWNGCEWSDSAPCEGTPAPCETLDVASCVGAPGCRVIGADGGTDAGRDAPVDAPADAGSPCMVRGSCDPFASRPCPSGQACIPDRVEGTRCVTLGFSPDPEGSVCSVDNDCAAGLGCMGGPGGLRCRRLCRGGSTTDCRTAGTVCGAIYDASDSCLRYCMQGCDLYTQDCPTGQACVSFAPATGEPRVIACLDEGTVAIGGSCAYADECVRGGACIGGFCRELCSATIDCAAGTCAGISTSGLTYCL